MTKQTAEKFHRRFVKLEEDTSSLKQMMGLPEEIEAREKQLSPTKRIEQGCKICKKPMLVSIGQLASYHKECRAQKRNYKAIIEHK